MKKTLIIGIAIAFAVTAAGSAFAKFACKVEKIDGTTMVLKDCNEKKLSKIKVGNTVSISKKRKKLEGC